MTILKIAEREFKSIVKSPVFLGLLGVCSLIWSYNFVRSLLVFAKNSMNAMPGSDQGFQYNIHYAVYAGHIDFVNFILVILVPTLTMKLVTEERRRGTLGLLLTSPISSMDITLGKYFGGLAASWLILLVSFLYPLFTFLLGDFPMGALFSSYFGLVLAVGLYTAIGLFFSSLTPSPVLAVILGVCFNIVVWNIGREVQFLQQGWALNVFEQMSMNLHFTQFLKGSISLNAIVYLVSLSAVIVYFTERIIESVRWR